ncbi:hypothetical protein ACXR0O_25170 [Verrucomicrobiota bacterium sgz303538]
MLLEYNGRTYSTLRGSDVTRDGMFLSLSQAGSIETLMEVFYSDADGSFTVAGFGNFVPIEVVEQFLNEARKLLPPERDA